jgi:hypothetical protein
VETDLDILKARRWHNGRRERPFRFLLDSRVFRLLCDPERPAALDNFRASLARLRLAPEGLLPDLEMTPLAVLDAIGVELPVFPALPYLPKTMAALKAVEVGILIKESIQKEFKAAPQLQPESLRWRMEELREATDPAAHEVVDLCLARFGIGDTFEEDILEPLILDALFTFRFPDEYKERMNHLFDSFLLNQKAQVAGLTRMRRLKGVWDRSLLGILKKNPRARREILAIDQEMRLRTYRDLLAWEVIYYAILGYARKAVHPVIGFSLESRETLEARCKGHKTALRAFLDDISHEELTGPLRPWIKAWTPGWLVPCREDGTLGAAISTGEVPIWTGIRAQDGEG